VAEAVPNRQHDPADTEVARFGATATSHRAQSGADERCMEHTGPLAARGAAWAVPRMPRRMKLAKRLAIENSPDGNAP